MQNNESNHAKSVWFVKLSYFDSHSGVDISLIGLKGLSNMTDINWKENKVSAFDELALECIPKEYLNKETDLYSSLLDVSCFIASLTDGLALEWYKKLN